MRKTIFVFALLVLLPRAALAQTPIYYPWCAVYGGMGNGGTNCGFSTLEQCRATISGMGGSCQRNPFYEERVRQPVKRARRHAE